MYNNYQNQNQRQYYNNNQRQNNYVVRRKSDTFVNFKRAYYEIKGLLIANLFLNIGSIVLFFMMLLSR